MEELVVFGNPLSTTASGTSGPQEAEDIFAASGLNIPGSGFAPEGSREIGVGEKLRRGMEAETGEEYSTGHAVASRVLPFAGRAEREQANEKTNALESLREQYALDDIKALSPDEYAKNFVEREAANDRLMEGVNPYHRSALDDYRASGGDENALYENAKKKSLVETIRKAGLTDSDIVKSPELQSMTIPVTRLSGSAFSYAALSCVSSAP